ncbi:MAG: hypothetical protein ABIL04_02240 [candidate division WOR-3 bacterium]
MKRIGRRKGRNGRGKCEGIKGKDWAKEIIKEKMEGVVKLNCPLAVNIGIGKNWDCHP